MLDLVESAVGDLRMTPCPGCADRALQAPPRPDSPCRVTCARCDRTWDVLAQVTVVRDRARLRGNCCSGFRHHDLTWRQGPGAREQTTRLRTWAQDHLVLRPGDVVSVLCETGDLLAGRDDGRKRRVMPLIVANHTLRGLWALAGSAPVRTLR
jgi:hypothetical protein